MFLAREEISVLIWFWQPKI